MRQRRGQGGWVGEAGAGAGAGCVPQTCAGEGGGCMAWMQARGGGHMAPRSMRSRAGPLYACAAGGLGKAPLACWCPKPQTLPSPSPSRPVPAAPADKRDTKAMAIVKAKAIGNSTANCPAELLGGTEANAVQARGAGGRAGVCSDRQGEGGCSDRQGRRRRKGGRAGCREGGGGGGHRLLRTGLGVEREQARQGTGGWSALLLCALAGHCPRSPTGPPSCSMPLTSPRAHALAPPAPPASPPPIALPCPCPCPWLALSCRA